MNYGAEPVLQDSAWTCPRYSVFSRPERLDSANYGRVGRQHGVMEAVRSILFTISMCDYLIEDSAVDMTLLEHPCGGLMKKPRSLYSIDNSYHIFPQKSTSSFSG